MTCYWPDLLAKISIKKNWILHKRYESYITPSCKTLGWNALINQQNSS